MGVLIVNEITLYEEFIGLEKDIIDEFNMVITILNEKDVSFDSASKFLDVYSFRYFSVLSINQKIYVRQITPNGSPSKVNILKVNYNK